MVIVTQADRDAADAICNPKDNPYIYNILCKKFAAHRIAAIEECANKVINLGKECCSETLGYAECFAEEIRALKGG